MRRALRRRPSCCWRSAARQSSIQGYEFTVKRLHTEEEGSIRLVSDNAVYKPIRITEAMHSEVWCRVMYPFTDTEEGE
ncbi:MAG: S24 family peptidase [Pyrinomonadaceae bacterium]